MAKSDSVVDKFMKILQPEATLPPQRLTARGSLDVAVEEAYLMLNFIVQKGIAVDDVVLETVSEAKAMSEADSWTTDKEPKFWRAYQVLSEAIRPATISSIKASRDEYGQQISWVLRPFTFLFRQRQLSMARISVLRYRATAIVLLLLIIIVQIYAFTGSQLTKENREITATLDSLMIEIWKMPSEEAFSEAPDLNRKMIEYEMQKNLYRLKANYDYLMGWQDRWKTIASLGLWQRAPEAPRGGIDSLLVSRARSAEEERLSYEENKRNITQITYSVGFPLQVINMYILPLLYGLLGACAYVLRELSEEIQRMTFSTEDVINYNLRIQLGALSGLVVGWFLIPGGGQDMEQAFSVYNLGPFALAFIAGYSIELLFSAMDRFIGAFSNANIRNQNNGM